MSNTELTPNPRRSQRQRKPVIPQSSSPRKRKRTDSDEDSADSVTSPDEDANEPEYRANKTQTRRKNVGPSKKSAAKKPRTTKPTAAPKLAKTPARRGKKVVNADEFDAGTATKEAKIASDNPIFNTLLNPAAALQSTVEDFLDTLQQSAGPAQAELINAILRSCGSNDSVDADQVVDYDGVVDALDNFTEGLKQDDTHVYPLTSKLPVFKSFHKSLAEFIERLISSAAEVGLLYSSDMMTTLSTWVIAMSSSQIRSFRHTATFIALEIETALCEVAAAAEKEAEVVGRQREGEKKRKAAGQGGGRVRAKELETKASQIREQRTQLAEFIKEFVDGVFVHRYRDLDPNIRAECVLSLGKWFTKYPSHFLDPSYLRYVGWVLSDADTHVRLEAVRALSGVYDQGDYIGSLNHFTERFKPRLIEMAKSDIELGVRVAVIQVLAAIDSHSLMEDEEREGLCLLAFEVEPKVRKAVGPFVKGVWKDAMEERMVGKEETDENTSMAGFKALAALLVKWSRTLDRKDASDDESDPEGTHVSKEVISLLAGQSDERTRSVVEALWDEVDPVSDWSGLLDFLLLDHSAGEVDNQRRSMSRASEEDDSVIDDTWRLEEAEEGMLIEVLIASIQRAQTLEKKGDLESLNNDITRALIKGVPKLITKHQTDQHRIAKILLLPPLMNLDLYLEMRILTTYAKLWEDVTKQFLSHSSLPVLTNAVEAIGYLLQAKSLSNTNTTKFSSLEDDLSTMLRDAVAGREEMEVATLTEDEVISLTAACSRLAILSGKWDMSKWIEENEGGKQSSAWDILNALVERGRLGYKEEELMVEQAMLSIYFFILWKVQRLGSQVEPIDNSYRTSLIEQRDIFLEKVKEFCVGTQSNTTERIKHTAFKHFINLYIVFHVPKLAEGPLFLEMEDNMQHRCAEFLRARIEQYVEENSDVVDSESDESDSGSEEEDDDDSTKGAQKKKSRSAKDKKGGPKTKLATTSSKLRLDKEHSLFDAIATFSRGLMRGVIHFQHSAVLLVQSGRLGPPGISCAKTVAGFLQQRSGNLQDGELISSVICQTMRDAFDLVLDDVAQEDDFLVSLGKVLHPCLIKRGTHLAIVSRVDSESFIKIHTDLLSWIIKRIATSISAKNKKAQKAAISLFRGLLPLLANVQPQDAVRIKSHMDKALVEAKIEVLPASKLWEPQRAYDKRLTNAASKANPPTKGKRGRKPKEAIQTDDEDITDAPEEEPEAPPPPRPRPRRVTRSRKTSTPPPATSEDDQEVEQAEQSQVEETDAEPLTPVSARSSQAPDETTPVASRRKRPRDDDEESGDAETSDAEVATPTNDAQIRRKRVRH